MLYPLRMPMELWIKPTAADLVGPYMMQIMDHNKKVMAHREGEEYADSGFDLYIPRNPDHNEGKWVFPPHTTVKIPLGIKIVNRAARRTPRTSATPAPRPLRRLPAPPARPATPCGARWGESRGPRAPRGRWPGPADGARRRPRS